tara:strand:- start:40 stop:201 length:162 start_codon:yes stop_codon:yes gene_type:complete
MMMIAAKFQTAANAIGHGHQMIQLNGALKMLSADASNDLTLSNLVLNNLTIEN